MKDVACLITGAMIAIPLLACSGGGNSQATCSIPSGEAQEVAAAKLIFEYQSTDNDTGLHGLFDAAGWSQLCVYGPDGDLVLMVQPQGPLKELTMAGLLFESREPLESELPQASIVSSFPAGEYRVTGTSFEGTALEGAAMLTHDIPLPPVIVSPKNEELVVGRPLVVSWQPVTETVTGDPASVSGYEVIVTNESQEDDPDGFSHRVLSVHLPPDATSLTVPAEFLEEGTEYELEVIALETSGNQTIRVAFFETE